MPTERFNRLPEEKKQLIRDAAKKEFARVPFDKVSINKIVREAEISRGSFYTYFEDKWDLLGSIFEDSERQIVRFAMDSLQAAEGDVWTMAEQVLERIFYLCSEKSNVDFAKNIMSHISPDEVMRGFDQKPYGEEELKKEAVLRRIYESCDRTQWRNQDFSAFFAFFQLELVSISMAVKGYFEGRPVDRLRENFRLRTEILKKGVSL